MVRAEHSDEQSSLSYEAFLAIAQQQGIDLSDGEHLARLYQDVGALLREMAELVAVDVGLTEPSHIYVPGSEVR
jgi:hypothetical protein